MKEDLPILSTVHSKFHGFGVSAIDSSKILIGRPFGGVAILWRKSLNNLIKIIDYKDPRILGIEIKTRGTKLLLICLYMPTDCKENEIDFLHYLGKLDSIIQEADTSNISIIGDWNADPTAHFGRELADFCSDKSLLISDIELIGDTNSFTYISDAFGTTSWLDHCVSTMGAHNIISSVKILEDFLGSDHLPVSVNLDINQLPATNVNDSPKQTPKTVNWNKVDAPSINRYCTLTENALQHVNLPINALNCKDPACTDATHRQGISDMYNDISKILKESSDSIIREGKLSYATIPGWNEHVKEQHEAAREAFLLWKSSGQPRTGIIWDMMRRARARFKYSLRACKSNEDQARADAVAWKLGTKKYKEFWSSAHSMSNNKVPLPSSIDNTTGETEIAEYWRNHYCNLLNSVKNDRHKNLVLDHISQVDFQDNMVVTASEVEAVIRSLSPGKSAGLDGLTSEHLKYAGGRLRVLLSMWLTSILVHTYVPDDMIRVVLVPLLKSKSGLITDSNNYRPIALANIFSKLLEHVILSRCEVYLTTSDNQFGFKPKHSTDQCIFAFKEVVRYYIRHGSPVFACYLDASKAFDRVNHWTLFNKLVKRGVPSYLIKILVYWYRNQSFCVRWGNTYSDFFLISNGVRQGSILSPLLFNVYIDDLNLELNATKLGCKMGGIQMNNFSYADDMVILAPSMKALRKLISTCELYAIENDIIYNVKKTEYMIFKPSSMRTYEFPPLYLYGKLLKLVSQTCYLGCIIANDLSDDEDIKRQYRSLCGRANMLIRKFQRCSEQVRLVLFRAYCTVLYCSPLWCIFAKNTYNSLRVCYNNTLRWLLHLRRDSSAKEMFVLNGIPSFGELTRKNIYQFKTRINNSANRILRSVEKYIRDSSVGKHWETSLYNF